MIQYNNVATKTFMDKTLLRHLKGHRILCIDTKVIIACQNLCLKLVYKGNCEQNKNINDFLNASVYSRGTTTSSQFLLEI